MRVLAQLDPVVLERELLQRIDGSHPRNGTGRTLVVVPTTRLVTHVKQRLSTIRSAWLELDVLDFRGLAFRLLESRPGSAVEIIQDRLLDALLHRALDDLKQNAWTAFVHERPGAIRSLRETLQDLRDAGILPAELAGAVDDDPRSADLAALYRGYSRELERAGADGRVDGAGLIRRATRHAATFAESYGAIWLYGTYELIGVHLELVRELDRGSGVTALVPLAPGTAVSAFSESHAREFLLAGDANPEPIGAHEPRRGGDLVALFDEAATPAPADPTRYGFRHAQGAAAEVGAAVAEALAAVREGTRPGEIVISARTLEPYAAALEEAFDDAGLPWTSSLRSPLRRHPAVRDFLLLLEVVAADFPRRPTAELLRSPRIRWKSLLPRRPRPDGHRAEVWSRKARLIGGLEEWTGDLARWAAQPVLYAGQGEEDREEARQAAGEREQAALRIGEALKALNERVDPRSRRWSEHGEHVRALLREMFRGEQDESAIEALAELDDLLADLAGMESVGGDDRRAPFETMVEWVGEAVEDAELTLRRRDNGGIRVLDAMQLRGLTMDRLFVLGMNSGLFPRPPREDPMLPDALRHRLRRKTGRPLPVKAHGAAEERLLLAILLGSARERVEISWQRADEAGRAKTPSLALREIARVALGVPDVERLRAGARHLRSHPLQRLQDLVERPGLISPDGEMVMEALQPRSAARLEGRFPFLAAGLEMLRATQSFTRNDPIYDARIGPRELTKDLSVSDLETLGTCPLKFFFSRVLRVRELEDPASTLEVSPRELGAQVHELLERIYRVLSDEGLFAGNDAEPLVARALQLVDEERDHILGDVGTHLGRRVPVLRDLLTKQWLDALRVFVREDLEILHDRGLEPAALEELKVVELDFGRNAREWVRGKFDRLLRGERGEVVSDYKTSGNIERRVNELEMLRGRTLQVPLYWMMAGETARVELLGVGPSFEPDQRRRPFEALGTELAAGFRETMQVLIGLRNQGVYPFRSGRHCEWCDYIQTCRRKHPPTIERQEDSEDARLYELIQKKSKQSPIVMPAAGDNP